MPKILSNTKFVITCSDCDADVMFDLSEVKYERYQDNYNIECPGCTSEIRIANGRYEDSALHKHIRSEYRSYSEWIRKKKLVEEE